MTILQLKRKKNLLEQRSGVDLELRRALVGLARGAFLRGSEEAWGCKPVPHILKRGTRACLVGRAQGAQNRGDVLWAVNNNWPQATVNIQARKIRTLG